MIEADSFIGAKSSNFAIQARTLYAMHQSSRIHDRYM